MKQTNDKHELQCMKCKKYFDTCVCFKSDGYIPKILYCERCYGFEQGRLSERERILKIIKNKKNIEQAFFEGTKLDEYRFACIVLDGLKQEIEK